jgi:hypothetical protein
VLVAGITCGGSDSLTLPSDALPAALGALSGDAQDGVVGQPLADSLVVRVTDSKDRPVLGQQIEFRSIAGGDSALLQPDTAITDADGRARSRWKLGDIAGVQTVRARVVSQVAGRDLVVTFTASAAPGAADTIVAVRGQDQVGQVGATLPDSLVAAVTDRFGNPLPNITVQWTVPAGQGSASATSTVTGSDGRTGVRRTLGGNSGSQTTTVLIPSVNNVSLVFDHTALAGGAVRLVLGSPDNQVAPAGSRLADSLVVQAQDVDGNGVPGETITWEASDGGTASPASSVTDFSGKAYTFWTLPTTAGTSTLAAAGFGNVVRFHATASGSEADTLRALSPLTFTSTAGQGVSSGNRPSVRVSDNKGNPVAGVPVMFSVTQGGGTISDGNGTGSSVIIATSSSGVATLTSWTLGIAAGSNVVKASATRPSGAALTGSPLTFTATGTVGTAFQLVFGQNPSTTTAGSAISPPVTVLVKDRNGNTVTGSSQQVTIALGANPGSGSLSGTQTISATNGVATFSNLSINRTGAGYTLVATASGLGSATSSDFNVNPGTPSRLGFLTQPSSAGAGATITPPVRVAIQDQFGNTVTNSAASVSLAIGTNPASGTLSGGGAVGAINGVATFSNLSINAAGSGYTLVARSGSLATATSAGFSIGSGGGNRLAFVVEPSTVAAGAAITPAVQVAIQDANGNVSTSASDSVFLTIGTNPGGAALTGAKAKAVNGVATFSALSLDKAGTGYTLHASAGGLTGATSSAFNVTAGTGQKLVFSVQPDSVVAGQPITPAVKVQLRDANDNVVTTFTGQVTVALGTNPSNGALSGTRTVAAVAGVATFGNLSIDSAGAGYTLTASAGTATAATSIAFNVTAGAPASLVYGVQPSNVAAGATIAPAVTVKVVDGLKNVVTTSTLAITIALGNNPGNGTLSGTRTRNAVAGVATFADLAIDRTGTGYTLSADDGPGGLAATTSTAFNVQAGTGNKLVFLTQPTNTAAGAAITPPLEVAVQDAAGNTITSATDSIRLSLNPSGNLGGTVGARAVNGIATFSDVSVGVAGTGYTLTAFAPLSPLISATSSAFNVTQTGSTTTIASDTPDPSVTGQAYTVGFQVTATGGTPTGNVTVSDGTVSCQGALVNGVGSCQLTGTAAGGVSLTATYAGDATFTGSTTATPTAHTVNQAATVLSITGDTPDPSSANQSVTVSYSLAVTAPGGGTPTGNVTVTDGVDSCTGTVAAGSCAITLTTTGTRTLTAAYSGDAGYAVDTATTTHTVGGASTTTSITSQTPNPSDSGQTYRVAFSVTSGASGTPTGTVTVSEGAVSCNASVATGFCDLVSTVVGDRTLTATYAGDGSFAGSVSAGVVHTVTGATAPVYHLGFSVQPSDTRAGDKIQPPVKVLVLDQNDLIVDTDTVQVTVTLGNNPLGLATLGGGTVKMTRHGVANFDNLKVTGITLLSSFNLIASAAGMSDVASDSFSVTP